MVSLILNLLFLVLIFVSFCSLFFYLILIVLFICSKSYCPFCVRVKKLFEQLGATFKAIELDGESDGSELQSALAEWTGQRTVPNVFINGKHIGGCDDTLALNNEGKLVPLLTEAGAIASSAKTTITA